MLVDTYHDHLLRSPALAQEQGDYLPLAVGLHTTLLCCRILSQEPEQLLVPLTEVHNHLCDSEREVEAVS